MSFAYEPIVQIAQNEITDKGQSVILTRNTPGTFDPATGTVTGDSTADEIINAVVTDYREDQIDDAAIKRGDKLLLISAKQAAPEMDDSITIDSLEYQIVDINTVSPGGTDILYKVQVRR